MVTNTLARFFFRDALTGGARLISDDCVVIIRDYITDEEITRGNWYNDNILNVITSDLYVIYFIGETTRRGSEFVTVYVSNHRF